MKKRIISWLLAVCILFSFCFLANAESISTGNLESEVANRIENIVSAAYSSIPGEYDIGNAVTIYNANSESIYYVVPIFHDNECVGTVQIGSTGGVILTDETTLYASIVNLPSLYVFYTSGRTVYAESPNEIIELYDIGFDICANEAFELLSYTDKVESINQHVESSTLNVASTISKTEKVVIAESEASVNAVVAVVETQTCDISTFVCQGNYNLCWAACVATIVNYKTGSGLTAKNVAKAINHSYSGATVSEVISALTYYSLTYRNTGSKIAWTAVKSNISNDAPFIIGLETESFGHMVTGYGYCCSYGDDEAYADQRYVNIWDPNGSKRVLPYYDETYDIDGNQFTWTLTLVD